MDSRTAPVRGMVLKELRDSTKGEARDSDTAWIANAGEVSFEYVQWHEELHVTQGLDEVMKSITPAGATNIRDKARDTVVSALAYMGDFGQDIAETVVRELNKKHLQFCARHPNFDGKVLLLCHSLGSAIMFDVLSEFWEHRLGAPLASLRLDFSPSACIMLGSPVGALLASRRHEARSVAKQFEDVLMKTKYMNVFHPCDPVAYRLEPLIDPMLGGLDPIELSQYTDSLHAFDDDPAAVSYTHLTLPTKRIVELLVVAASLKKKKHM
eukprot:TRINITY_DN14316_c0_g2_i1.p1 TRINITY_DN14316_c0_g2~~TRINITY_DN14316_c0_g2_i1.p1  ORF type:complete len:268 (-),score=67.90 TRINITY_DN14316_c0_g2_i1:31-834(-)